MANPIILAVDQQNRALVVFSATSGVSRSSWPKLFQGSVQDLQVYVVNPTGNTSAQYSVQVLGTSTCKVTACSGAPNGNGTQTIVAGPLVMSWTTVSSTVGYFSGSLDLTQSNLASAIGINPTATVTIEIEIVTAAINQPIYQESIVIYAPADANAVVNPQPPVNYLTAAESDGRYVLRILAPGDGILFTSDDGTQQKLLKLTNGGAFTIA